MKRSNQLRLTLGKAPESVVSESRAAKPVEKSTVQLFRPFMAVPKDGVLPLYQGLLFDEGGISASNQHLFLHIDTPTERRGIYRPNGKFIFADIPRYSQLLEELEKKNVARFNVDVEKLHNYLLETVPLLDSRSPWLYFYAYRRVVVGYDAEYLLRITTALISQGVNGAVFRYRADESVTRSALYIVATFPMGKATLVLMPLWLKEKPEEISRRGIANYDGEGPEPIPGIFSIEEGRIAKTIQDYDIPSNQENNRNRKKTLMSMKAKALTLKLKLLTL